MKLYITLTQIVGHMLRLHTLTGSPDTADTTHVLCECGRYWIVYQSAPHNPAD